MVKYFRDIIGGLWTLLVGMKLTLKYALSPTITAHYPFQTLDITPNYRGHTDLVVNPKTGKDKCIVCMMCQRACPSDCISLKGEKPEGAKKKVLTEYCLDFTKCSLCANCVETCPTNALEFSQDYNLAGYSRHDFHFDLVQRFRDRARSMGVEPKIADLTPVPLKPKAEPKAGADADAKPVRKGKPAAGGDAGPVTEEASSADVDDSTKPPAETADTKQD